MLSPPIRCRVFTISRGLSQVLVGFVADADGVSWRKSAELAECRKIKLLSKCDARLPVLGNKDGLP